MIWSSLGWLWHMSIFMWKIGSCEVVGKREYRYIPNGRIVASGIVVILLLKIVSFSLISSGDPINNKVSRLGQVTSLMIVWKIPLFSRRESLVHAKSRRWCCPASWSIVVILSESLRMRAAFLGERHLAVQVLKSSQCSSWIAFFSSTFFRKTDGVSVHITSWFLWGFMRKNVLVEGSEASGGVLLSLCWSVRKFWAGCISMQLFRRNSLANWRADSLKRVEVGWSRQDSGGLLIVMWWRLRPF